MALDQTISADPANFFIEANTRWGTVEAQNEPALPRPAEEPGWASKSFEERDLITLVYQCTRAVLVSHVSKKKTTSSSTLHARLS